MERKPVGKKAEPTQEELEFIYERLGRLSDQELLEEMQDTEFPLRSLGFIKRRRREYNAAKKVLQELIRKQIDPVIIKRKEQHFDHLADIAKALLSGNLANVTAKSTKTGDQFDIFVWMEMMTYTHKLPR